jgi:hypothetical protein
MALSLGRGTQPLTMDVFIRSSLLETGRGRK